MNSYKWIATLAIAMFIATASRSVAQEPIKTIFGDTITYEAQHDKNRKKGRGISNMLFGFLEFPKTIVAINTSHGGYAALTWGVLEGWDRWMARERKGWQEYRHPDTRDVYVIESEFHYQPDYDNRWRIRYIREAY